MLNLSRFQNYLWAVGFTASRKSAGRRLGKNRYHVISPQVWIDTQPYQDPDVLTFFPEDALPYLYLYPYKLHIPEVYGFCHDEETDEDILLLENVPLTETGELLPSIVQAWSTRSATRQLYWLWQMLELWAPFYQLNVASSLLSPDNIRVDGWRVRLKELILDKGSPTHTIASFVDPTLSNLAQCWSILLSEAKPAIADALQVLCDFMHTPQASYQEVSSRLNLLLLEQAAKLPLHLQIQGISDIGQQRSHNEDACYPLPNKRHDDLAPRLAIICDGIGGHEGGEIASQMAIQTLQIQIRALLTEIAEQSEPIAPEVMCEELSAIVRVVNNMIAAQNNAQAREARRRMGTTVTLALQLPQRLKLPGGGVASNAHELYVVNVGDSRAYWITRDACNQLLVDDDVAVREVRMARAVYREALKRPDSGALTQALGTRDGSQLYPSVRRFILEEDGFLLLCSDGLSDNGLVEHSWQEFADRILNHREPLESVAQAWVNLANERNGHDNVSLVLLDCLVSSSIPELRVPIAPAAESTPVEMSAELEEDNAIAIPEPAAPAKRKKGGFLLKTLLFLMVSGGAGLGFWSWKDPAGFMQARDRAIENGSVLRDRAVETGNQLRDRALETWNSLQKR
jgi:protein phosphatase